MRRTVKMFGYVYKSGELRAVCLSRSTIEAFIKVDAELDQNAGAFCVPVAVTYDDGGSTKRLLDKRANRNKRA